MLFANLILNKFICVSIQKLLMYGTVSVLPLVYIWSNLLRVQKHYLHYTVAVKSYLK